MIRPGLDKDFKHSGKGKQRSISRSKKALSAAIEEALLHKSEKTHVQGDGPLVSAVRLRHVREAFARFYVTDEEELAKRAEAVRKAFKRALEQLGRHYASGSWAGEEWVWAK